MSYSYGYTPPWADVSDGAVWHEQLDLLGSLDDGLSVRMVLATMSANRLFATALVSRKHFEVVSNFVDFLRNNDVDEDDMSDGDSSFDDGHRHTGSALCSDTESDSGSDMETDWPSDVTAASPSYGTADSASESTIDSDTSIDGLSTTDVDSESYGFATAAKPCLVLDEAACSAITDSIPCETRLAAFPDMPVELGLEIVNEMPFDVRVRLAKASHGAATIVAQSLQDAATLILRPFGLRFGDVRLMQTATGVIIGGSAVASLLQTVAPFQPGDLDFIAGTGIGSAVVLFLERAGLYRRTQSSPEYSFALGIGFIWTLVNDAGKKINVIEALGTNPFDAVGNFHLTCVYGAWCANGLLHCYPSLTTSGNAITTRAKFPHRHDDHAHHTKLWNVLHKYTDRGFSIALNEYNAPHTCGVAWSCPATIRRTDDAGCSYTPFPSWLYDDDAEKLPVGCWTMGGTGCSGGILSGSAAVHVATASPDLRWKGIIRNLLLSPTPPIP
ncbi:hypothetical protein DFH06DRAFT_1340281 [Mycena polygramma]|nr:hypothetical protein DFH06DRAFT_1340281 [Mycena polygramma]